MVHVHQIVRRKIGPDPAAGKQKKVHADENDTDTRKHSRTKLQKLSYTSTLSEHRLKEAVVCEFSQPHAKM